MSTPKKVVQKQEQKKIAGPSDLIGIQIGDFQIESFIAQGGMAVVYLGTQVTLRRPVAIKILKAKLSRSPKMIARFNREVEALSTLTHPNIVNIFGKGKAVITGAEHYFFAMEFVQGKSLRWAIHERKIDEIGTYRIILEILDALDYAHQNGIIHRDIKPENILLTPQNHIKISDFGIAHFNESDDRENLTEENVGIGTKAYMAPEQGIDSRSVDARADIYSVGVLLYEMLTGIIPRGVFEPATVINDKLEYPIDPIIFKAMAHDREKRYNSAKEMHEKLESFLQTSFLEQHHPQPLSKAKKSSPATAFFLFITILFVASVLLFVNPFDQNSQKKPNPEENKNLTKKDPETKEVKDLTKTVDPTKETKEVPTKEVPTKEVPTKEVPTKEVPTKEVPTKEVPTKEVPTKEVPTKEVPTKEVPTKEVPTKEVPTKEVPTKEVPLITSLSEGEQYLWIARKLIQVENFKLAKSYLNKARLDKSLNQKIEEGLQEISKKLVQKGSSLDLQSHALRFLKREMYKEALPFFKDANRFYPSINLTILIDKSELGIVDKSKMKKYEEILKNTFLYMGYGRWAKGKEFLTELETLYPRSQAVSKLRNLLSTLEKKSQKMTLIKLGRFPRGGEPTQQIFLSSYFLDKYEVSQLDYAEFVKETSFPPPSHWKGITPKLGEELLPICYVNFHDALAYALWKGKELPTEAQWEKAARGTAGNIYPWGNTMNKAACNFNQSGPQGAKPVDAFPQGVSSYGCFNMAGNVWEWCRDYYQDSYDPKVVKNPEGPTKGLERVVRGGGWTCNLPDQLKTMVRHHLSPEQKLQDLGFRLVLEVQIPEALDY